MWILCMQTKINKRRNHVLTFNISAIRAQERSPFSSCSWAFPMEEQRSKGKISP